MSRGKGKRNEIGQDMARKVLEQTELSGVAPDPNPVVQRWMEQARAGIGEKDGGLPAAFVIHLLDRAYGKVVDRVKLSTGKSYEGEDDSALLKRLETLKKALKG